MKRLTFLTCFFILSCGSAPNAPVGPYIVVLGIAQDGGSPHAGCQKDCCERLWNQPEEHRKVACLGIVDPETGQTWLIDATPDFSQQLHMLTGNQKEKLAGIFLTHAHIGHYTGLIHLGQEVMGARSVPVYAMPRMKQFLESNGPWDQLVKLNNISLRSIEKEVPLAVSPRISVKAFTVPHRDEYSETVGYRITGPKRTLLYIPDIDKWEKWKIDILKLVKESDYALLDGSFFENGEIPGRDMSEIPHPFIVETMEKLHSLDPQDRSKVYFIHLNHTNPALQQGSHAVKIIGDKGFRIAAEKQRFEL